MGKSFHLSRKEEEMADRRSHEAQICYCGEPGCVGYIGGKTQTDIGGINDLFLDALGIKDQVEAEKMKGSKKKKARHLDEDFTVSSDSPLSLMWLKLINYSLI